MTTRKNDTARRMRAGRKGRRDIDKRTAGQPRERDHTRFVALYDRLYSREVRRDDRR